MNSRDRVFEYFENRQVDRLPLINPTSVATVDSCRIAGVKFNEVHLDADKMAALAAVGHEHLCFDSVMPYFSVIQEAAAFDCEINWGDEISMPNQKSSVYADPEEFEMPGDFLERLPIKTVIEAIKLLKKRLGSNAIIIGKVMGPWTLSYHLRGVEDFLVDTVCEPEKAKEFLNRFKKISKTFAEAQFEAGADFVTLADHATADMVSPVMYKELLLPVHKEINKAFGDRTLILHCCGYTQDRISLFAEAGFKAFHFDSKNDIGKMVEAVGSMKLTGCVNNPEILLNGTTDDVRRQVNDIIDAGVGLISPECAVPLSVKNENLMEINRVIADRSQK